jgi:hypothetical protein
MQVAQHLAYHRAIGVDHAIIYDRNGNTSDLAKTLQPFVDEGFLTRVHFAPTHPQATRHYRKNRRRKVRMAEWNLEFFDQVTAMTSCVMDYGPSADWIVFSDTDEVQGVGWVHRRRYKEWDGCIGGGTRSECI